MPFFRSWKSKNYFHVLQLNFALFLIIIFFSFQIFSEVGRVLKIVTFTKNSKFNFYLFFVIIWNLAGRGSEKNLQIHQINFSFWNIIWIINSYLLFFTFASVSFVLLIRECGVASKLFSSATGSKLLIVNFLIKWLWIYKKQKKIKNQGLKI